MNQGPEVEVKASCVNCVYCCNKRYQCQGDSGWEVRCEHPDVGQRPIGDTAWRTPAWCPFLGGEIGARR